MSAAAVPNMLYTVDEYLQMERAAKERHVYLDGAIIAMAGESDPHGRISFNLVGLIFTQLRGKPCQGRTKDTKVRSGPAGPRSSRSTAGLFSYPDVVVICGDPEFHDEHRDVVTNPTAIIEVLSPSTEAFDRGEKFHRFERWNPTLTDYLLVSQEFPQVEQYTRQPDGSWRYQVYRDPGAAVAVESIGVTLRLADVYDRVRFPAAPAAE